MLRAISKDDIPLIVSSLQGMREESDVGKESDNDPEYVTAQLEPMFASDSLFGFVAGDSHGFMFGYTGSFWYCQKLRAFELSLYVKPEYRGGTAAPRLIKAFTTEAIERGVSYIHAGSIVQYKTEKLFTLYERLGYERHGSGMRYKVLNGH
jgi:GNAT superfamily N-acetyltransferase